MELLKEILVNVLGKEDVTVLFPNLKMSIAEIVETECYKALLKIKTIIEDDSLSDNECFMQIEEIICLLEKTGDGCKNRHDFG